MYPLKMVIFHSMLVGGFNPSERYEFVSRDYDIPNCFWKVIKFHGSSHHQPVVSSANYRSFSNMGIPQTIQVMDDHDLLLKVW